MVACFYALTYNDQMKKQQIPNLLTIIRMLAIPVCVFFFYLPMQWTHYLAAGIFALASITDFFDGYLARKLEGGSTPFGAFLDPVADKLMVSVILVVLVGTKNFRHLALAAAVIVGREIVVSALREWMAELGKRANVKVNRIGKIKTTAQMSALFLLLLYTPALPLWVSISGSVLLYVAAGLTLYSMIIYLKTAWPHLTSSSESQ